MSRPWRILLMAFLPVVLLAGYGEGASLDIGAYPAPVSETVEILNRWLRDNGYTVSRRDSPSDWRISLDARKEGDALSVELTPQSPLASLIRISAPPGTGPENSPLPGLQAALQQYLATTVKGTPPAVSPRIPSRDDSVYCIKALVRGTAITFTGFAVDPRGFVVTTAHDLEGVRRVTLTGADGVELNGTIIKRDPQRDLTLIKVRAALDKTVSLRDGRRTPRTGESVYMVRCSGESVEVGTMTGPPALVNGRPYWQVHLDIEPGASGSPVFDAAGRLLGVAKGRLRWSHASGFLIPLKTVTEFLRKALP